MFDIRIPFSVFTQEIDDEEHIPQQGIQQKTKVHRAIVYFTILRSLYLRYMEGIHKLPINTQRHEFDDPYFAKFGQTLIKWKQGKVYQFEFRHMVECNQKPIDKRLKPTPILIVEDEYNLVLVEPSL